MKTIKWIFSSYTSSVPSTTFVFSHKCLPFGFDMAEFVPTQLNAEEQDKHNPPLPGIILLFQKSVIEKFACNYFQTKPSEQLRGMHPKLQPSDFVPKFPSLRSLKAEIQ